jgi:hypothetical protein
MEAALLPVANKYLSVFPDVQCGKARLSGKPVYKM